MLEQNMPHKTKDAEAAGAGAEGAVDEEGCALSCAFSEVLVKKGVFFCLRFSPLEISLSLGKFILLPTCVRTEVFNIDIS